jgi:hypothetical protein
MRNCELQANLPLNWSRDLMAPRISAHSSRAGQPRCHM